MNEKKMANIKKQDIGIEIETIGQTREKVAIAVANYFGTLYRYVGGTYDSYEVKDNRGRTWKFMRDSSLSMYHRCCEVVSPVLYWGDLKDLENIVNAIREAGACVDDSCGIHIHIGAKHMDGKMLKNLVNTFRTHENLIYDALEVDGCRYRYCRMTDDLFVERMNESGKITKDRLLDIWYNTLAPGENRNYHYNQSRYRGLNLHAVQTKGTVEFRMFNGTLDEEKIIGYIQFCMAIMSEAETMRAAKKTIIVTDNEKFAMRNWLRKLGLNGDDFKQCRNVMLSSLRGNSAIR